MYKYAGLIIWLSAIFFSKQHLSGNRSNEKKWTKDIFNSLVLCYTYWFVSAACAFLLYNWPSAYQQANMWRQFNPASWINYNFFFIMGFPTTSKTCHWWYSTLCFNTTYIIKQQKIHEFYLTAPPLWWELQVMKTCIKLLSQIRLIFTQGKGGILAANVESYTYLCSHERPSQKSFSIN